VFKNQKKDIFGSLDSSKNGPGPLNRAKLNPIVKNFIFCGRQVIPLRGHSNTGTLALAYSDPEVNGGNFRAVLLFKIGAGDIALKEHLEAFMRNAIYISLIIQNEIFVNCGDLIFEYITNCITQSCFSHS